MDIAEEDWFCGVTDLEYSFINSLLEVSLHPVVLSRGRFKWDHLQGPMSIKRVPVNMNSEICISKEIPLFTSEILQPLYVCCTT
ncbi:hypothetical protein AALO_G00299600 [Alosa alosa]|uniref:Uncharacterized protein n=1 Tax=Alosa alosa TaxID=278164 RepID=A0AAV6FJ24_9TELE|nr:hypothetical protein AALO_G00299600 [Alosa alosa]